MLKKPHSYQILVFMAHFVQFTQNTYVVYIIIFEAFKGVLKCFYKSLKLLAPQEERADHPGIDGFPGVVSTPFFAKNIHVILCVPSFS